MAVKKDMAAYLRDLRRRGYTVTRTKNSHYQISWEGRVIRTVSGTPSDPRSLDNLKADIRRFERGE